MSPRVRIIRAGGRVIFKVGAHQRALTKAQAAALMGEIYRKGWSSVKGIPGREYALTVMMSRINDGHGASVVLREVFADEEEPAIMGVGRMSDRELGGLMDAAMQQNVVA